MRAAPLPAWVLAVDLGWWLAGPVAAVAFAGPLLLIGLTEPDQRWALAAGAALLAGAALQAWQWSRPRSSLRAELPRAALLALLPGAALAAAALAEPLAQGASWAPLVPAPWAAALTCWAACWGPVLLVRQRRPEHPWLRATYGQPVGQRQR